jgi:hypothetical protein
MAGKLAGNCRALAGKIAGISDEYGEASAPRSLYRLTMRKNAEG